MFQKVKHIHFVGIGGIGMSGIAEVLKNLGYEVSGSDMNESPTTKRLKKLGVKVSIGHAKENVKGSNVVVMSSAVKKDNVEIINALEEKIPVIPRAEMLAELMRLKYGIAISGTHGKTTTTSIVAAVLSAGGLDPTIVIGGKLNKANINAKLGQGKFLIAEADESDGSFLKLSPTITVITNIDREHLDYYDDLEEIKGGFVDFANKIPFYGLCILCLDEPNVQSIIPKIQRNYMTYGINSNADIKAYDISDNETGTAFKVTYKGDDLGEFTTKLIGAHNVYNTLAAIGIGLELEVVVDEIKKAVADFDGVQRRFEIIKDTSDILIVDDYAHHPTEIQAVLKSAKERYKRNIYALFQPHRYSRTMALFDDFSKSFYYADNVIVTDIYSAGEDAVSGISSQLLVDEIKKYGHSNCVYMKDKEKAVAHLKKNMKSGDMLITLGAGDIYKAAYKLAGRNS
jgi:UDP-N-acetylmuramate--alanine ligase